MTAGCGFTRARVVTCITYVLLRHRARYIQDPQIVLLDIIVEYIGSFRRVDLPFKHCLHTQDLDRRLPYIPKNVLGILILLESLRLRTGL